jgi:phage terminase large subunit-like protein
MVGFRLGKDPRIVITTTPRPTALLRALINDPTVVVTHGSTYWNRPNLAPEFLHQIFRKYRGTRLGRQEIEAENPRRYPRRAVAQVDDRGRSRAALRQWRGLWSQ